MLPEDIFQAISRAPVGIPQDENELQESLAKTLPDLVREHRFSVRDRVDFFDQHSGVAIEVKMKGSANNLLRQLKRYSGHLEVASIIVVTTSARLAASLPESLGGKPIRSIYLVSTCL